MKLNVVLIITCVLTNAERGYCGRYTSSTPSMQLSSEGSNLAVSKADQLFLD